MKAAPGRASGLLLLLAVTALQLLSRFGPAPVADFTLDDWSLLQRATAPGAPGFLAAARQEADRPLAAGMLMWLFGHAGDRPALYALFGALAYTLAMACFVLLVRECTGGLRGPLAAGAVLALWPTCTESFNWPTMIGYAWTYVGYAGAAWAWVRFVKGGPPLLALLAAVLHGLALFHYEIGLPLLAAYFVLAWMATPVRRWTGLALLAATTALYLAWKLTQGFGTAPGFFFPSRELHFSFPDLAWNTREALLWWVGPHLWNCLTFGWTGFAQLGTGPWLAWAGLNVAAAALLFRGLRGPADARPATGPAWVIPLFFLAWFGASLLVGIFSWNCGRLTLLPAMGLAGLAGWAVSRLPDGAWRGAVLPLAVLGLMANQGTALQWRESGRFHRRVYEAVRAAEPQWRDKEMVLFDTAALRQRLTPGLAGRASYDQRAWAFFGNAGLLRGFALDGMVGLAATTARPPMALLDAECGARVEGDQVLWHARFNDGATRTTALARVHIMDALAAGAREPGP